LRSRKALMRKGGEVGEIHGLRVSQRVGRFFVSWVANAVVRRTILSRTATPSSKHSIDVSDFQ
jgi:hypothetical protein